MPMTGICHAIVSRVLDFHPEAQALYLYGSFGTPYERDDSDVDLALLLPHGEAKALGSLSFSPCSLSLADLLGRPVDLVNLRLADTVFQARVLETGRVLHGGASTETQTFEMLTLSFYQKLNDERALILEEIERTGRAYGA